MGALLAKQQAMLDLAETVIERELRRVVEPSADNAPPAAEDGLQRRYEMSLDDIRQLREANSDLQQQLSKARSMAKQAQPSGRLDWEAEKRRIMAALEADCTDGDEQKADEHLKIADVVRKTDQAVAAKDSEIEELKLRLEQAAGSGNGPSADAGSIRPALDSDAEIQQERERLKQLQAEWQEKLRRAEVEMSVERAKMARQHADLEEQLRAAKGEASEQPVATESNVRTERSFGGRWLAHLGLTAADREPGRRP